MHPSAHAITLGLILSGCVLLPQVALAEKCGSPLGALARAVPTKGPVADEAATVSVGSEVWAMAFGPDGQWLATGATNESKVYVWDWRKNQKTRTLEYPNRFDYGGGISLTTSDGIAVSPNKSTVVACNNGYNHGPNGSIVSTIWDSATGSSLTGLEHNGSCAAVTFNRDGSRLLLIGLDGAFVYTTNTWRPLLKIQMPPHSFPQAAAFSPDGKFVALGTADVDFPAGMNARGVSHSRVHIMDVGTGMEVQAFEPLPGTNRIDRLAWRPDGSQVAVAESKAVDSSPLQGATVAILEAKSGRVVQREQSMGSRVRVLMYSPDGRYQIIGGLGDSVQIWDGAHQKLLQEICAQPAAGAVSRDGHYFALGGEGRPRSRQGNSLGTPLIEIQERIGISA
jgi:WD40 repeat protein